MSDIAVRSDDALDSAKPLPASLETTEEELLAAARWSRSHDPSEGYERILRDVLGHMGVDDANLGS